MINPKSNTHICIQEFAYVMRILSIAFSIILITTLISDVSEASEFDDAPHLKLVDIDGNIITEPLP